MSCKQDTYKRLGDYIREVDVRNRDMQCTNLLGLSIAKVFIPSIANTVGTDFCPYKIVKHNQFAYVPVTSRNGEKITVALYDGQEDCIISQAYTSFEIKNTSELLPQYLMMWFRRPEFDRYARFKSHGSAREVFDWEEMCNVMMPIPDTTEQQRIVDQYNAIQTRIENNKRTIAKLEETAQALYRKMFVDDIDPENLPEGWRKGTLADIAKENQTSVNKSDRDKYSYYLPIDAIPRKTLVYGATSPIQEAESSLISFSKGDIIIGAIRPYFHKVVVAQDKGLTRSTCMVLNSKEPEYWAFLTLLLFEENTIAYATNNSIGTTMPYVNWSIMQEMEIIIPHKDVCTPLNETLSNLLNYATQLIKENLCLEDMLTEVENKI